MPDKKIVITDTSILINFLNIDRIDLLVALPHQFLITEHVVDEITTDFVEQYSRLNTAIQNKELEVIRVDNEKELDLYNELIKAGRLGSGECSAIACAINRKYSLAMEDYRASKQALRLDASLEILKTQDIVKNLITHSILTVEQADLIKLNWQTNYRFSLKFASFSEIITMEN